MDKFKKQLFTILLLFSLSWGYCQTVPDPMTPKRLVNDFSGLFSSNQISSLESKLREFNNKTSTQIVVVTVNDLQGMDISQYTTELAHKWGVGQDKKDNGIVVLVKPKTSDSKGEVFIAVGYGLEGAVPDITAKGVVSNEMIPMFQNNDMYGGVDKGVGVLMSLVSGEYTADEYQKRNKEAFPLGLIVIIAIIILGIIGSASKSKHLDMDQNGDKIGGGALFPFIFFGGPSRGGSDFGSFSSGRGSFGGGGFGGFGGGGFGGGGAGGSW